MDNNALRLSLPVYFPCDLDLTWQSSILECLTNYKKSIIESSEFQLSIRVKNTNHVIELIFGRSGRLDRIQSTIARSNDFWEGIPTDEYHTLTTKYRKIYRHKFEDCKLVFGVPNFSGDWDVVGYPATEIASPLTYWIQGGKRIQLEYDHQDKELPIIVRLSTVNSAKGA